MRKLLFFIFALFLVQCLSAKRVVVTQKQSEQYAGNITQHCIYRTTHKNIEIINHLKYIEVKRDGATVASFDPVQIDRNSLYIWVGLSPNGKMILFTTSDQGTFICNLKGQILYRLGKGVNATNWWTNRYLVGMVDQDNGLDFTYSDLVLVDIKKGTRISIPTDDEISIYPCAAKPYLHYFTIDNVKHTIKLKFK